MCGPLPTSRWSYCSLMVVLAPRRRPCIISREGESVQFSSNDGGFWRGCGCLSHHHLLILRITLQHFNNIHSVRHENHHFFRTMYASFSHSGSPTSFDSSSGISLGRSSAPGRSTTGTPMDRAVPVRWSIAAKMRTSRVSGHVFRTRLRKSDSTAANLTFVLRDKLLGDADAFE